MDDSGGFDCTMQALQAMAMLGQTQSPFFEEQRKQAVAYLTHAPSDHHHRRAAEMLAFAEGMAALQSSNPQAAQTKLEQLQALEAEAILPNPQHLSMQLAVEMALASQADELTALQAARADLDDLGSSRCALVLLQAQLADSQGETETVDVLLERIVERQCRPDAELSLLTIAQSQLWQAERAHAAGQRDDAVQIFHALQPRLEGADSSLEIHARVSSLAAALSLTE